MLVVEDSLGFHMLQCFVFFLSYCDIISLLTFSQNYILVPTYKHNEDLTDNTMISWYMISTCIGVTTYVYRHYQHSIMILQSFLWVCIYPVFNIRCWRCEFKRLHHHLSSHQRTSDDWLEKPRNCSLHMSHRFMPRCYWKVLNLRSRVCGVTTSREGNSEAFERSNLEEGVLRWNQIAGTSISRRKDDASSFPGTNPYRRNLPYRGTICIPKQPHLTSYLQKLHFPNHPTSHPNVTSHQQQGHVLSRTIKKDDPRVCTSGYMGGKIAASG